MSLIGCCAWRPVMDIVSPIHRAHSDYCQQVQIAPPRTDRQAHHPAAAKAAAKATAALAA